jgi:NADPH:quinone reductase-like Zn-dependent oxidoreductase
LRLTAGIASPSASVPCRERTSHARRNKVAWLRACGASDVFDYDDPRLEEAVRAIGITITAATTRQLAAAAAAVNALLAAGRLTMRIAHVYTLAEAAQAHRLV